MTLRFKIKHLMYLTLWSAILLTVREPLVESLPLIAETLEWLSGIGAIATFAGLYGVAIVMPEGSHKDRTILLMFNLLIGDLILLLILVVTLAGFHFRLM